MLCTVLVALVVPVPNGFGRSAGQIPSTQPQSPEGAPLPPALHEHPHSPPAHSAGPIRGGRSDGLEHLHLPTTTYIAVDEIILAK